jgi:hypothetical protein
MTFVNPTHNIGLISLYKIMTRLFIVVVAAFIKIRFKGLRLALRGSDL